jgi:hypothetical protein
MYENFSDKKTMPPVSRTDNTNEYKATISGIPLQLIIF